MNQVANGASIEALAGPFTAAALALLPTGLAKLRRPAAAARAMRAVGVPGTEPVARTLGVAEVLAGGAALAFGGRVAAGAVAALYLAFAIFLIRSLRAPERPASCGCVGDLDLPPNGFHLGLVLLVCAVAAAGTVAPVPSVPAMFGDAPLDATVLAAGSVALVYAAFLVVSLVPGALASYRPGTGTRSQAERPRSTPRFRMAGAS
jgi:hypothetical protein